MKRLRLAAVLLLASGVLAAAWYAWHPVVHWIAYATGSYNTSASPHNYNYNSGFGSIIEPPLITLAGVVALFWWHHQCHVGGCFWYARRVTAAGDRACWKHHPENQLSASGMLRRHRVAAQPPLLIEVDRDGCGE